MLERAAQKLRLDQLVIQQGRSSQVQKAANKDELLDMIHHGAEKIVNSAGVEQYASYRLAFVICSPVTGSWTRTSMLSFIVARLARLSSTASTLN